nr:lactadherin-like [Lytechinus pictus]
MECFIGGGAVIKLSKEPDYNMEVQACLSNPCPPDEVCEETTTGFSCQINETDRHLRNVSLLGGSDASEGRVGFTADIALDETIHMSRYSWTMQLSHKVCQQLGFTGAAATLSGNIFPGSYAEVEDPTVGEIHCPTDNTNLPDCWFTRVYNRNTSLEFHVAVKCCAHGNCSPPGVALGIESGDIVVDDITTSSCSDGSVGCSEGVRLNSILAWKAAPDDQTNAFIQVHILMYHMITAIITQGGANGLVTSFKISYGPKETELTFYEDAVDGIEMVFPGNYDSHTPVTTSFTPYILAKYFRIHPKSSVTSVSMRFELIGYGPLPDDIGELKLPFYR